MSRTPRKLSRRLAALGLAIIASLAFAGLAAGSASALSVQPENGKFPLKFTASGGVMRIGMTWGSANCTSSNAQGEFTSATSGFMVRKLEGCTSFGGKCTTPGQPAGTINSIVNVTPVYLDAGHTTLGLRLTPFGEAYSLFNCGYGQITTTGSVLSRIASPGLNAPYAIQVSLSYEATGSTQKYQQIEGSGTKLHLNAELNGATAEMALEQAEKLTFAQGVKLVE